MSAFASLAGNLFATVAAAAGVAVTYHRADGSVELTAVPGRSEVFVREDGRAVRFMAHDFLVRAADLVIEGDAVTPKRDDRIVVVAGGVTTTYQVLDPPYKPCDGAHRMLRVYTKRVSVA